MRVEYFEWWKKFYRRIQETPIYANRPGSNCWCRFTNFDPDSPRFFERMTRNWYSPWVHTLFIVARQFQWIRWYRWRPLESWQQLDVEHKISPFLWNIGKHRHDPSLINSKQPGKGPVLLNAGRCGTCVLNEWMNDPASLAGAQTSLEVLIQSCERDSLTAQRIRQEENNTIGRAKTGRKGKNSGGAFCSSAWQEGDNGGLERLGLMKLGILGHLKISV